MTRGLFDGIDAISTIALASAAARWLPREDQVDRAYLALALALAGILLGNRLWKRMQRLG